MKVLTREGLLKKEILRKEKVDLGKDEYVFVRQMTGRERDRFEQSLVKEVMDDKGQSEFKRSLDDFRAKLAVHTVCDEDGNNLLRPEDVSTLSQNMSAARLELIVNKAQELNRISEEDKKNLTKNSEAVQNANSISDSAES
ncbi:MAG TPA: hypothetical protein ENG35_04880 [Desulfobacteraceae bacterium]|nr:hypothetical protein [Desulfobacteraceae bacterium]